MACRLYQLCRQDVYKRQDMPHWHNLALIVVRFGGQAHGKGHRAYTCLLYTSVTGDVCFQFLAGQADDVAVGQRLFGDGGFCHHALLLDVYKRQSFAFSMSARSSLVVPSSNALKSGSLSNTQSQMASCS